MPDPSADALRTLDARPAEAFSRLDERGTPRPQVLARRREQRRCEGVWVLPVSLADDLSVQPTLDWLYLAQAMPEADLVQQGDIWECPLRLDPTRPWPAHSLALVLMLWPHVNRPFLAPLQALAAEQALAAAGSQAETARQPGAAAADPLPDPLAGAPTGPVLEAILAALDEQGRPEGSLASGLVRLPVA